jgi:ferredoxin
MDNGKPVWKGKTCAHCMSCIQNCPAAAIEYGKKTKGKKHYYFEKYRYALNKCQGRVEKATPEPGKKGQ